jgi:transposase
VRGFDAGKKVNGRKRHRVVDTMGLSLLVVNASASVQDRGRARTRLDRLTTAMPSLSLLWADGGYAGKLLDWSDRVAHITVEIVRKPLGIKMFQALPGRWVVERAFAWIVKSRRLDHDYERLPQTNAAMIKWADDRIDGPTTRAAPRPQAVAARLNRRLRLSTRHGA